MKSDFNNKILVSILLPLALIFTQGCGKVKFSSSLKPIPTSATVTPTTTPPGTPPNQARDLEADHPLLFDQPVKLGQARDRQHDHDEKEHVVRNKLVVREQRGQHDCPQDHGAQQAAGKNLRLRWRRWSGGWR
jgi:hypothetical protein